MRWLIGTIARSAKLPILNIPLATKTPENSAHTAERLIQHQKEPAYHVEESLIFNKSENRKYENSYL